MPRQYFRFVFLRVTTITAALLIFSVLAFGQAETILHDFVALPHGSVPQAPLLTDSAGNLYGTTTDGGLYGYGTVFKLSSSNGKWSESILYNFINGIDGSYPTAGLIFDAAGNLYGTTTTGGSFCATNSCFGTAGTVFELTPNSSGTWSETTLYSFGAQGDGNDPVAGLILDKAGNLYGTTYYGGPSRFGSVFELSPSSQGGWTETVLLNFTDEQDGGYPMGSLVSDSSGNLYGTASVGGDVNCNNYSYQPWGCGVVFKLTHNSDDTWSETVLHSFEQFDGAFPNANVVFDAAGNLVGTTVNGPGFNCGDGCGTVFQLTPGTSGSWSFKSVYSFAGGLDGGIPKSGLVLGADGNFYGTTQNGGDANNCLYGCGTVFALTPTSSAFWKEKIIHRFSGSATAPYGVDGEYPVAALVFDQAGNLYGTAPSGGNPAAIAQCNLVSRCGGTVFKLSKDSSGQWMTALLYSFAATGDALQPSGPVVADAAGNLYGASESGGSHGYGAVFQLIPQSTGGYRERVIYSFLAGADGYNPYGGLVRDSSGNLFGATLYGGVTAQCTIAVGCGAIFELTPAAGGKWIESVIYRFTGQADGGFPAGPLALDSSGNVYGTTGGNGSNNTVFRLSPSSSGWTLSVLYTFTGNTYSPGGGLAVDASGNVFGTAQGGAHGSGVTFELSPSGSTWTYSVLHNFSGGADGVSPYGVALGPEGNVVGITIEGGDTTCSSYGCGTVYQLVQSAGTWKKQLLHTFAGGTDGAQPETRVTFDAAGNVYGTTLDGGFSCAQNYNPSGCGTIYKITRAGNSWTESIVFTFGLVPHDIGGASQLLLSSSNVLYGTSGGGDDGYGTVFQIDLNQAPASLQEPPASSRLQHRLPQSLSPLTQITHSAKSGKAGN